MPQLDGLRALAVMGVLVTHYWSTLNRVQSWGHYGVLLFFVISGYLINGILLRSRKAVKQGDSVLATAKRFYVRRALRIFPIYYMLILVLWSYGYSAVREPILWHLTYMTNIYTVIMGKFPGPIIGHVWSLAVEEQFYLLWPWIVLCVPRQFLSTVLVVTVLVGPVSRLVCVIAGVSDVGTFALPTSCLDSLGIGALLAYVNRYGSIGALQNDQARLLGIKIGLPVLSVLIVGELLYKAGSLNVIFKDLATALLFGWLVASAARGFSGIVGSVLSFAPLVYVGKISYGIYLYHLPILFLIRRIFEKAGIPWDFSEPFVFVLCTACTIAVAATSWHLLEKRVTNLKRFFA